MATASTENQLGKAIASAETARRPLNSFGISALGDALSCAQPSRPSHLRKSTNDSRLQRFRSCATWGRTPIRFLLPTDYHCLKGREPELALRCSIKPAHVVLVAGDLLTFLVREARLPGDWPN